MKRNRNYSKPDSIIIEFDADVMQDIVITSNIDSHEEEPDDEQYSRRFGGSIGLFDSGWDE